VEKISQQVIDAKKHRYRIITNGYEFRVQMKWFDFLGIKLWIALQGSHSGLEFYKKEDAERFIEAQIKRDIIERSEWRIDNK
jgi:hypothetical protein